MARISVVGDGPAGLSAALFLAKGGHQVAVHGDDKTAVHFALLRNYLGLADTPGNAFQETARSQVAGFGAHFTGRRVTMVTPLESGFTLALDDGASEESDYLILAEGRHPEIAAALGLDIDESGAVVVDTEQRTSRHRVYAAGRATRPNRSQAIISAGAGAVAALDILAAETGADFKDWDSVG